MGLDKIIVGVEAECKLEYQRTAESWSSEEEEAGDVNLGGVGNNINDQMQCCRCCRHQWPSMAGSCQSVSRSDFADGDVFPPFLHDIYFTLVDCPK